MTTIKDLEKKMGTFVSTENLDGIDERVSKLEAINEYKKFQDRVVAVIHETFKAENFRNKCKEIMRDYLKNDEVINVVKNYAGREIDNRKLRSNDRTTTILIAGGVSFVVTIAGVIAQHFFK